MQRKKLKTCAKTVESMCFCRFVCSLALDALVAYVEKCAIASESDAQGAGS